MTDFSGYIYSICCVAIICAIIKAVSFKSAMQNGTLRLLCGAFLVLSILTPIRDLHLTDYENELEDFSLSAECISQQGYENYRSQLRDSIKANVEAYILDKAQSQAVHLQVEVTLSDDDIPVPVSVKLSGQIAPYAKLQMQRIIENELNIPKENQQWI